MYANPPEAAVEQPSRVAHVTRLVQGLLQDRKSRPSDKTRCLCPPLLQLQVQGVPRVYEDL